VLELEEFFELIEGSALFIVIYFQLLEFEERVELEEAIVTHRRHDLNNVLRGDRLQLKAEEEGGALLVLRDEVNSSVELLDDHSTDYKT